MAVRVNRRAVLAVALGLLGVPATVDALPIHFRLQTTESTLDVRDDANGAQDAAGASGFAGLVGNGVRNGALGSGGFAGGGGVGGGTTGRTAGGARAVRSGSSRRVTVSSSTGRRWIRGSGGPGFRSGAVWDDPSLLLIVPRPPLMDSNPPPPPAPNQRVPEPATAILFGSAVAFLSVRRLRRRHT
jgi:hypothetical protein